MRAVKRLRPVFVSFLTATFVLSAAQAQNIAEPIDTETGSTTAPTSDPQISDPEAIAAGATSTGEPSSEETIAAAIIACTGPLWQLPLPSARSVAIRQNRGKYFDGRGGIDTLTWQGPAFLVLDGEVIISFELINIYNDQFDTVAVLREFIDTTELREVEIISDWYDTIVLDPSLQWRRTTGADFSIAIFDAEDGGKSYRVITDIDAYVIDSSSAAHKQVSFGTVSSQHDLIGIADAPWLEQSNEAAQSRTIFRWDTIGSITPDLRSLEPSTGTVVLDMRNEIGNSMRLDLTLLAGAVPRRLEVLADSTDSLYVVQSKCWTPPKTVDLSGQPDTPVIFETYPEFSVSVFAQVPKKLFKSRKDRVKGWTAEVKKPGYYHLSASADSAVGAIDLRNGAKDVMMVRNDGRIRPGEIVPVYGDPGLDEVWLVGSAGWRIGYLNSGAIASTLVGEKNFSLAFAAGIEIRILPAPPFVTDPRLSEVPHYPGLRNKSTDMMVLNVTRGGYVRFSGRQLIGKSVIDTTNGIANVIEVSSATADEAADVLYIRGDRDLDVFVPIGLSLVENVETERERWIFRRTEDEQRADQRIIVEGLKLLLRPNSVKLLR